MVTLVIAVFALVAAILALGIAVGTSFKLMRVEAETAQIIAYTFPPSTELAGDLRRQDMAQ